MCLLLHLLLLLLFVFLVVAMCCLSLPRCARSMSDFGFHGSSRLYNSFMEVYAHRGEVDSESHTHTRTLPVMYS